MCFTASVSERSYQKKQQMPPKMPQKIFPLLIENDVNNFPLAAVAHVLQFKRRQVSPFGSRHIFLGFTRCGRYVLSYTSDCGEDDDFSFYTYHLYWWEFNLHSRLKQVSGRKPNRPCRRFDWQTSVRASSLLFPSGPSCATVCRGGNLQRPVPHRV